MAERIQHLPSLEYQRVIRESAFVTQVDELADRSQALGLCQQISAAISNYNRTHLSEMLDKSPEQLLKQFIAGLSVLLVHQNGGEPQAIFHATAYSALSPVQSNKLNFQVYEAGSVITMPEFQNLGIGKRGSDLLAYVIWEKNENPIWLATNKQAKAFLAMTHGAGMEGADFHQLPYLTGLTCTCKNCSELFGFSCQYRRPSALAAPEMFDSITVTENNGHMPCTLIVSDLQKALDFETICRQKSVRLGITPAPPGQINIDIMTQVSRFFNKLNEI